MRRRGFALLAVLWVTVALSALAGGAVARAQGGEDGARARIAALRARWAAEGCLAAAHARLGTTLEEGVPDTVRYANGTACGVGVLDPSARLNPDSVGPAIMARFEVAVPADQRAAYLTHDGDGRVNLNAAPAEVLRALPGFSDEAVRVVLEQRQWGRVIPDLQALADRLSPSAREAFLAHLPELLPLVTFEQRWAVLRAAGWTGDERPAAVIEEVVVPAGGRLAVVERRVW